jgi:hypothetical protein
LTLRSRIEFTKHAREKFEVVRRYGFEIDERKVIDAIQNPTRIDRKNAQYFAIKAINVKYALRVVYERRKDYLVVITFYPVRRERYGI